YILVAALVVTFIAGATASTAYALLSASDVGARQFNVTYVGVSAPVDSIPDGNMTMVLTEMDGNFLEGQSSQITVDLIKTSFTGIQLINTRSCDTTGTSLGWCIQAGTNDWAVIPLPLLRTIQVDNVSATLSPAHGLGTYRATVQKPTNPSTDGVIVTINIDGFVNKLGGPVSVPALENYVLNPGFEDEGDNWERTSNGGRSIDDDTSHSGENSLRMVASGRWPRLVTQEVLVSEGATYDASAWVKTEDLDSNGAWVELMWLNATGLPEEPPSGSLLRSDILGPLTGTNDWTELTSAGLTAPAGAVVVRINLWMAPESHGSGKAWFDDIALMGP
ncbi:MAG: hypothetical protein O2821_13550, partial [Chloroflexi bacterium]|nr:hypothetical protein [Chloroflexota bacterium]